MKRLGFIVYIFCTVIIISIFAKLGVLMAKAKVTQSWNSYPPKSDDAKLTSE